VIGNVLHNAAKFTRPGDEVSLSLQAGGPSAEIRVRDTGAGIEPALLPRIFDAFVQGDRTLARTEGGLGLGLALVKGLVELHGGSVRAASEGAGCGSEFVISLPLCAGAGVAVAGESNAARLEAGGMLVLIVEDNLDAAQSLADVLELDGHRTMLARTGAIGISMARDITPDVVVCDLGLPDVSGYEVASAIRRVDALRSCRLVALSGYAQPEDRRRAVDAGFDVHLAKPADVEVLRAMLAKGR
jgi:CheY-like chemotaxis protein